MASGAAAIGGALISKRASDKASRRANRATRRFASTGRSRFDTRTGQIRIDPSIREETQESRGFLQDLRLDIERARQDFQPQLAGIREQLGQTIEEFRGNEGAFLESQLNPIREALAAEQGAQARDFARRSVSGTSFAQGALGQTGARGQIALADVRAQAENQRINTLSGLLQLDAGLLREGLSSETGRIKMLSDLEQILLGITNDEFNREIEALALGSGAGPRSQALDSAAASSRGIAREQAFKALGTVFEGFDRGTTTAPKPGTFAAGAGFGSAEDAVN